MKLRKTVRKSLSMILAVLMMVTSVFTNNNIVFAGSDDGMVDGTTVSTPAKGTSYYFNFQDKTSSIYAEDGTMNTGTFGLMTIDKAGRFHSADHGMNGASQLTFKVAGNCTISIGGCFYTGANDQFVMSASAGALDATSKAAKTAKCYNASCTDGTDRVSFVYQGGEGTVTLVSPGSYIPQILITPLADDYESDVMMYADGTAISTLPVNTSYYVDLRKKDSVLYDAEGSMNTGKIGLIEVVKGAKFHSADHGMWFEAKINLPVTGDCTIVVGGCAWGNMITVSSETGTFDETSKSNQVTCFKESITDGSDRITFKYTGEAGVVTFSSNTYVPYIQVIPVLQKKEAAPRKVEVWDFAAQQETNTDLYNNNITADAWTKSGLVAAADGKLDTTTNTSKEVSFGNLTVKYENGDKLYGAVNDLTFSYGGKSYSDIKYADGYKASGLWYCNGSGGTGRRYVTISNVKAGDKIVSYMGSYTGETDTLHFLYLGTDGKQDDTAVIGQSKCEKYEFVAKYDGTYKIYLAKKGNVKPVWHRVMQIPSVQVKGTVDVADTGVTKYGVKFLNKTTLEETDATVNKDGSFTAALTAGFKYTAILTGNVGVDFTDACKEIEVKETDAYTGMKISMTLERKNVCELSGTVTGFAEGFDTSKVRIVLTPESVDNEVIYAAINTDGTYNTVVEPNIKYTASLKDANDYKVSGDAVITVTENSEKNLTVEKKPVYKVSGKLLNLTTDTNITSITFVNMDDKYEYPVTVSGTDYSVDLRDATYEVKAVVDGYSTISHVIVKGADVARDLLFLSTAKAEALPLVSDIYVGYTDKENNYATVRAAVAACKQMNPQSEADRITVHIAPGTYREQVIVDVPYISFVNDEPDKEVLLTWYYGIGYVYYSIGSDGYYSEAAAFDKFEQRTAQKWGSATYIKSSAKAFRAENIKFESSFNKYMTDEEIADGVTPGGQDKKNYERTKDTDVASLEAVERAAALAVEGDQSEFYNCTIVSSQDTLYTGNNIYAYFKNCFIDGNTDYIFGGGNFFFDACELSYYGYSNGLKGAALTAAADGTTTGYIFRNCYISANPAWKVASSHLGRPWRQQATVTFINTKVQAEDTVLAVGWTSMACDPKDANYKEYNTTLLGGAALDLSQRTQGTVQSTNPYPDITTALNGWTPVYYTAEESTISFTEDLSIKGDLKTGSVLKAQYSMGANDGADASTIKWYRVAKDGTETLVKTSLAYVDDTYTVAAEDDKCFIKVVVAPETISGTTSEAKSVTSSLAVGEEPVKPTVDYTELDKAITAAEALKAEDYKDFTAVETALAAAKSVDKETATQEDVDKLTKALNDAVAALEKAEKPEEGKESIDLSKGLFPSETYGTTGLAKITVLDDMPVVEEDWEGSTAATIDGVSYPYYVQGSEAAGGMVNGVPTSGAAVKIVPEKNCKVTFVSKATSKTYHFIEVEKSAAVKDISDVCIDSVMTFTMKAGKEYYYYAEGSKPMLYAISLEAYEGGDEPVEVDYTELDKAVAAAEKLNAADYKDFTAVEKALAAAKSVDKATATQEDVDKLTKTLNDAVAALEKKPEEKPVDFTELDKSVAAAEKLNAADYKDFTAVETALAAAKSVDKATATQEDVDKLTKALNDAVAALEKKPEEKPEEKKNGFYEENGVKFWYEDGVKQGTGGRGKEIYDPETNAWYWLDAVQGGAVATSKDVYQEYDDGTNKWVRYDADGHMVKGWDVNGKYYFDPITGAMAKGVVNIDGTEYRFNDVTGVILDLVFVNDNGNEFWYENGIKQGTQGRGKEIYDPATDGWYWLDAIDGGKKAVSKDVYQESYAGIYGDNGEYGKWVRYDAEGKMVKGWSDDGRYYFDEITGAMAKGKTTIDGVEYTFDKITGILK